MALHVGIVIEAEFLRLVVRQLSRRLAGVELTSEAASPAEALASRPSRLDALIVDVAACETDPSGFASLCRLCPGRLVLIGNGDTVARAGLIIPPDAVQVPMGSPTAARDLSQLATRLEAALRPMASKAPIRDEPPPEPEPKPSRPGKARRPELVVIAVSTGGPEALQELLGALRPPVCPVVIALHIPVEHCAGLARYLAAVTGHAVAVGTAGPLASSGVVLLPGGLDHVVVERNEALCLRRAPPADSVFHPNGDVLFNSAAKLDRAVVGVVMTGMGNDGRAGAIALAARGYPVLAQTPATCAVPGMPGAAIAAGAIFEIAPPSGIAARLNAWAALARPGQSVIA